MSYAHQGPADVIVSLQMLGQAPVETLNEAVTIGLTSTGRPGLTRLEFAQPLRGPAEANCVQVKLPSGLQIGGPIVNGERYPDGSGWLTFKVEQTRLGCVE